MQSSYANVCNVASTREEVVLLFGINQAWQAGQAEIPIQLTNRVIISPYVAKRLATLLDNVLKEYETRFGSLSGEARRP
jgi:transaldolase